MSAKHASLTTHVPAASDDAQRALRDAFGRYATGVTIITARTAEGEEIGITANSFTSVSLDPAMVLWNIALKSQHVDCFQPGFRFAVNVLSDNHETLARHFGRSGRDQFREIDIALCHGLGGVPLIDGAIACFECVTDQVVLAGDHNVLIGRVERFGAHAGAPLAFHNGRFALLG
ncbi:flavin reductase family protein [Govanella unica]|uniref:Flavin reductase family protein n=1 Tax=Govanella unica TaxID=2975056 RepID=A0A9X3TV96_9PROT|nr:flavin reductase family protein [Govania unica]